MTKYRFEEIVINSTAKKKPVEEDKYTYLGLDNLDTGELEVTRFGNEVAPIGEKLIMKKGDVLFGKRRAYQKKVAIAPFDGIFSAHGMVLRPREDVIDKDFLPLFISSDYFLDAAIKISVGSLSPTINWGTLKKLEFDLPDIATQRKLAKVLWAILGTRKYYKALLQQTDELVKSQFIEMFGDPNLNPKGYRKDALRNLVMIERGGSPRPIEKFIAEKDDPDAVNWIKIGDAEVGSIYITKTAEKIIKDGIKKTRYVKPGDFLLSNSMSFGRPYILKIDGYIHDGWLVLRDEEKLFDVFYLFSLLSSEYAKMNFLSMAAGSTVKNLNKEIVGKLPVLLPPLEEQAKFASFIQQADKSKFKLQQSLENLELMYKQLIKENLG